MMILEEILLESMYHLPSEKKGKEIVVTGEIIPKNPDNLPRNVQIRGRYLDGNDAVGDWSQIEVVQTIP